MDNSEASENIDPETYSTPIKAPIMKSNTNIVAFQLSVTLLIIHPRVVAVPPKTSHPVAINPPIHTPANRAISTCLVMKANAIASNGGNRGGAAAPTARTMIKATIFIKRPLLTSIPFCPLTYLLYKIQLNNSTL